MLERFSPAAREGVAVAEAEARRFGHGHVGTEHLLLGILADPRSRAGRALVAGGATLDAARKKVGEITIARDSGAALEPHFSDRARRALERADRLSLRRREPEVEAEHVLIAVLDVEGRAGQVLRSLAVDLAKLRDAIDAPADAGSAADVTTHEPTCASCGTPLATSLGHQMMASTGLDGDRVDLVVAYCRVCGAPVGVQSAPVGVRGAPGYDARATSARSPRTV